MHTIHYSHCLPALVFHGVPMGGERAVKVKDPPFDNPTINTITLNLLE